MTVPTKARRKRAKILPMERRRYKRFKVFHDSLLCSEENLAEIIDISSGGIACRGLVGMNKTVVRLGNVELLNCISGVSVQGLECRRVNRQVSEWERLKTLPVPPDCYFEFVGLTAYQAESLARFIASCGKKVESEIVFS